MTAQTVSAADHMDAAFEPKAAKPVKADKADNNAMMAGADMYRRMQARPKSATGSATAYLIGGVAAIALIGGGIYFAGQHSASTTSQPTQVAATTATNADQQAQASNAQAQTAQKSAQASADAAQADAVAKTGSPPAAATDTKPVPARVVTRTHETVVHRTTVVARQSQPSAQPSASAASSGVDASALTAPPPPVTATQPAPTPTVPAPTATPAPDPTPAPAQPSTPPQ